MTASSDGVRTVLFNFGPMGASAVSARLRPFQDGLKVKAVLTGEETGRHLRGFELGSNSRVVRALP